MFKNTAGQRLTLLVIDTATNLPKTGDAANLTFYAKADAGAVGAMGGTISEDSATNAPGMYTITPTQAETNGDMMVYTGKSTTSGVRVVPLVVFTKPPFFSTLGINSSGHVSTVTTLTNLPTIPTNWLTAAGLASDAVAEIQSGLATSTNVTSAQSAITALLPDVLVNGSIKAYVTQMASNTVNANALDTTTGASDFGAELYTSLVAAGLIENSDLTAVQNAITALLPAALVSGRLDVSVGAYQSGMTPLQPTVAGRTLDVSLGGEAGIDLANVGSPTTTLNLSGTTISTSQTITSVSGAVGSVTGNVGGNVAGSVGSISGVTFPSGFGTLTVATIADGVWDEATSGHSAAGTTGAAIIAAGSAGDPWSTSLPGAYGAGTAGKILGDNLNATITSRMASYTQPTGFLAATFPTTVASASNVSTTETNILAKLPAALVSGRMDVSVGAYQTGLTPLQPTVAGRTVDVSLGGEVGIDWANVGSPTTTVNLSGTTISTSQAITSVSGAVGSVTGAVGSVTGNIGGNVAGSVGSLGATAQGNVRTAVGLAAANLDTQLAAIVEDTGTTIPAQISGLNNLSSAQVVSALGTGTWATAIPWNVAWDAEVQSECADALTAYDPPTQTEMDTAFSTVATNIAAVKTDTGNLVTRIPAALFAGITSLADWIRRISRKDAGTAGMTTAQTEINTGGTATFAGTTDSLESIKDSASGGATISDGDINTIVSRVQAVSGGIVAAQDASALYITEGDTWTQDIESLGNLTGKTVVFMMKKDIRDTDAAAIITIHETDGLTRINGAIPATGQDVWGSITILDANAGDIRLRLESDATVKLKSGTYVDGVKLLEDGADVTVRQRGKTIVSAGPVNAIT